MMQMREESKGFLAGVGAFVLWGGLVMFWSLLDHVPASQILAWRVVFSFVALVPVMCVTRRWHEARAACASWRKLWRILASTALIGINWYTYIWTVNAGRVLETSLGYYLTPLLSVAMGLLLLGERFSRLQFLALLLAGSGVLWALVLYGQFPWAGLMLAVSFASYGFIRKTVAVEALPGLFLETAFMLPVALGWILWLAVHGEGVAVHPTVYDMTLLMLTGVVTAVPLLLFAYSARHVSLTTVGFLQYISPTGTFLIGVFVFHEPFSTSSLITFGCIWSALLLHSLDSLRMMRKASAVRKKQN